MSATAQTAQIYTRQMIYTQHPLSAAFPAMQSDEFQALVDSIESIGVQNPITLLDGMVIDGWHRYKAATSLGMDCQVIELGDTDPRDFVLAQNKNRRHITSAQLATATTAVYAWYPVGGNQHANGGPAGTAGPLKSTKELAAIAGVGTRSIEQAKTVQNNAASEVQEAVKSGAIGLEKAVAISKLPMEQQAAAINKPLPKPSPVEPVAPQEPEYTELDAAHDQITGLQDALAVANIGSADPEEAAQAATLIAELRAHIKTLEATLKTVKISRDTFQNQVAEMQRQINRQRREIDRALGTKTA